MTVTRAGKEIGKIIYINKQKKKTSVGQKVDFYLGEKLASYEPTCMII